MRLGSILQILLTIQFVLCCNILQAQITVQNSGITSDLRDIVFVNENFGWAVGSKGTVVATEDGGVTWHRQDTPTDVALKEVIFTDLESGYIIGQKQNYLSLNFSESTLLSTKDGGMYWAICDLGMEIRLSGISFVHPDTGWVSGYVQYSEYRRKSVLLNTEDGGESWKTILEGSPELDGIIANVVFFDGSHGLIFERRKEKYSGPNLIEGPRTLTFIQETTDGGKSWTEIAEIPPMYINTIKIHGANVLWLATDGIPQSSITSGGDRTWHTISAADIAPVSAKQVWFLMGDMFYFSKDSGKTANYLTSDYYGDLNAIALSGSNNLIAVGDKGVIVSVKIK